LRKLAPKRLILGGGVSSNQYLRLKLKRMLKEFDGELIVPPYKYLCTDNAAMIGVAAHFMAEKGLFVVDLDKLDRGPPTPVEFIGYPVAF